MRTALLLLALLLPALVHAQAPPLTLTSPTPEDYGLFGRSVSGVPDADGDGHGDLLVGAPFEDTDGDLHDHFDDQGRAHLFSGATGELLRTLESPNPERMDYFGYAVSGVPDADGDGRGDLLVGAALEGIPGAYEGGRTYLFSGATGDLLLTLESPASEDQGWFGWSVSGVLDVDGDGRGDLLVGALSEDGGGITSAGRAYLFSGATGALLHMLQSLNPEIQGEFGHSVSGVPDADGDGRGDLLVGAYGEDVGIKPGAGRAYLFSGATGALLRTLQSPTPGNDGEFGYSVSGVPDVDGDGKGELLVGANEEDGGAFDAGRTYLFSGATGARLRTLLSPNPEYEGYFGEAVAGVEDADGDSRGDLLVGEPGRFLGDYDGRAYLFSGASGALLRSLQSPNVQPGAGLGVSVSGVPDGRGDLLVGAAFEDVGGRERRGRAYLFASIVVTASGSPTTIPPGGTVAVTVTVSNNTSAPATGDLWVVAERNGVPVLTRRIGSGTVPAGSSTPVSFTLTAPSSTPPSTYTINVNVGLFPNNVAASDAFDVTVTGGALASELSVEPFVVGSVASDVFAGDGRASSATVASQSPVASVSPNPFVGRTTLRFTPAEAGAVRLSVHDVLGREVAVLVDGEVAAGEHAAVFDARGLAAGVYVWRLAASGAVQTGRLTLLE